MLDSSPTNLLDPSFSDRDDLNDEYEKEKEIQIKKRKEGKGSWHQSLASASEADVCAIKLNTHRHHSPNVKDTKIQYCIFLILDSLFLISLGLES